jgi:hypothetical protein
MRTLTLNRWAWRAFIRTSLVPLLVVELALLGVYVASSVHAHRQSAAMLETLAERSLASASRREAERVSAELQAVRHQVELFAAATARAFATPYEPPAEELARYTLTPDGVYATSRPGGLGGALFYSGIVPIGPIERARAARLAQLDPLLRELHQTTPMAVQVYVNTRDSMNRIVPYFDVRAQYPAKMDIPGAARGVDRGVSGSGGRWVDHVGDRAGLRRRRARGGGRHRHHREDDRRSRAHAPVRMERLRGAHHAGRHRARAAGSGRARSRAPHAG